MKEGWTYKKLDEVGVTQTGTTPSKTNSANYGDFIPFIRPAEIPVDGSGKINYNTEIRLSEEGVKNGRLFKTNSVLMVCIGSIGKLGYLEQDASCNQQINVLTPNAEYDSKYVFYAMSTPAFQKESLKIAQGAQATLPIINKSKWSNLLIPIPPTIDEQHFIVSRLDAAFANIDALKANAERQLAEARKLFQAELTECMRPKEGWEEKPLKELTSEIGDGLHGTPKYSDDGQYFFVNGNNLENGSIEIKDNTKRVDHNEYKKYKLDLNSSTVLLSINGTIGKTAFYNEEPIILGKSACYINVLPSLSKAYLRYYLLSDAFINYAKRNSRQATIVNLGLKEIRNMPIPFPTVFSTQQTIASRLDALSANIKKLEELQRKTLAECDALKQAMLREVFE